MRKTCSILLAVLLIGLLCGVAWTAFHPREPVYQGRKLSQWLNDFGYASDARSEEEDRRNKRAGEAIRQIGTNTLPRLLEIIQSEDSPLKAKFIAWANKQPFIRHEFKSASMRRFRALWAIQSLGPAAKPLIGDLTAMLDDKDKEKRKIAAFGLAGIGQEAVPSLLRAITNRDVEVRSAAVHAFRDLGTNSVIAIPALIKALNDPDPGLRSVVPWTLGEIGEEPALVIPALIGSLRDSDSGCRLDSAAALAKFGDRARPAVPALLKALEDQHPWVRNEAAESLRLIAPETVARAMDTLIADLENVDDFVRTQAAESLGKYGTQAKPAVPALLKSLVDGKNSIAYGPFAAAHALDRIGPDALAQGLSVLITNLNHPSALVRRNTADTLRHLEDKAKPAVPALLGALQDEDGMVRNSLAEALKAIAPEEAAKTITALTQNLRHPDSRVRSDAADLLAKLGKEARSAIPDLFNTLKDRDGYVRYSAAYALSQIEPETAKDAVPVLIRQLAETNQDIRTHAARALAEFGEGSKPAVHELLKSLKDKDQDFRSDVGYALKRIDPEAAAKAGVK